MNILALALIYIGMLLFDAFVLYATGWLIVVHGWSAWWILAALIVCSASDPKYLFAAVRGTKASEP